LHLAAEGNSAREAHLAAEGNLAHEVHLARRRANLARSKSEFSCQPTADLAKQPTPVSIILYTLGKFCRESCACRISLFRFYITSK